MAADEGGRARGACCAASPRCCASTPTSSSSSRCSTSACRSRRWAVSRRARRRTSTTTPASITELHGRSLPGRRRVHQLHGAQAGRRRRADHAVERAADAVDLADRAGAGGGQHGRAQAGRVVAADGDAAGRACSRRRSCPPASSTSCTGFGETAGAPLSAHPGVELICFTGETGHGQADHRGRARRRSSALDGAGRQVAGGRLRGRRPELAVDAALAQIFTLNGQRCTAGSRLLVQRAAL